MAKTGDGTGRGLTTRERSQIIAALSRAAFQQRLGQQYGGKRDIYTVAGYPKKIEFDDYWAMYERGDVAGKIVDMFPQTTWRRPPEVVEPDMPEGGTQFTQAVEHLVKSVKLWAKCERADRLCGVGRYAVLLLGAKVADDQGLREELKSTKLDDLLYVTAYAEGDAKIERFVTDTTNPRFGQPEMYKVTLMSSGEAGATQKEAQVHASRILHVAEDLTRDEVFGRPRMQRSWNRMMDLEKVAAATGEAYWQLAARILMAKLDPDAEFPPGGADKTVEELEEIAHDLRRVFLGEGVSAHWLESTTPNPSQVLELYMSLLAASSGIPRRIMFGSETGERASGEDSRLYLGMVRERIERFVEPAIVRPLLDRLIMLKALPEPGQDGYEILWPELYEPTASEVDTSNRTKAETARALTPPGGDPLTLVEIDEERNVYLRPTMGTELRDEEEGELDDEEDGEDLGEDEDEDEDKTDKDDEERPSIPPEEREDDEDEEEDDEAENVFREGDHPRYPKGSDKGGEFAPKAGGAHSRPDSDEDEPLPESVKERKLLLRQMARQVGFPPESVRLATEDAPMMRYGTLAFKPAAEYHPFSGEITVYPKAFEEGYGGRKALLGLMAHEAQHHRWTLVNDWRYSMLERVPARYLDSFDLNPTGRRKFPDVALLDDAHTYPERYAKEDGVTAYSRAYWKKKTGDQTLALDETLAEMRRQLVLTGRLPGGPKLKRLYHVVEARSKGRRFKKRRRGGYIL